MLACAEAPGGTRLAEDPETHLPRETRPPRLARHVLTRLREWPHPVPRGHVLPACSADARNWSRTPRGCPLLPRSACPTGRSARLCSPWTVHRHVSTFSGVIAPPRSEQSGRHGHLPSGTRRPVGCSTQTCRTPDKPREASPHPPPPVVAPGAKSSVLFTLQFTPTKHSNHGGAFCFLSSRLVFTGQEHK